MSTKDITPGNTILADQFPGVYNLTRPLVRKTARKNYNLMIASNTPDIYHVEQPRLISSEIKSHISLGFYGEHYAAWRLFKSGYKVDYLSKGMKSGDLLATDIKTGEMFNVEVKTSLRSERNGRFAFCLSKGKHTRCDYSDILMLIAIDRLFLHHIFVVPVKVFGGVTHFAFRTHPLDYFGKLAEYRVRSSLIRLV